MNPLGALPRRFRQERLLVIGCGDVGLRAVRELAGRVRVMALSSTPERRAALRAAGVQPLAGNLDDRASVRRLGGLGTRVLHLAPPPREEAQGLDPRTAALVAALRRRTPPRALVYGSTSGVYGDCAGEWVNESRPVRPQTRRAKRRVDAECRLRAWGRGAAPSVAILRIPGIYALNREGGTPRERLLRRTPVLRAEDDVYTNHIHADDLARACVAALYRARPQRVIHVSDDSALKMGDYMDLAADLFGLPRPPRLTRDEVRNAMSAMAWSFLTESRRLDNARMRRELRLRLRYPTVMEGLTASC